jgi:hypothetical protein
MCIDDKIILKHTGHHARNTEKVKNEDEAEKGGRSYQRMKCAPSRGEHDALSGIALFCVVFEKIDFLCVSLLENTLQAGNFRLHISEGRRRRTKKQITDSCCPQPDCVRGRHKREAPLLLSTPATSCSL